MFISYYLKLCFKNKKIFKIKYAYGLYKWTKEIDEYYNEEEKDENRS